MCALKCDDLSRIGGESTNTLKRRPDAIYHLRARAPPPSSLDPRRPSQPHSIPPGHGRSQCTAPARVRVFPVSTRPSGQLQPHRHHPLRTRGPHRAGVQSVAHAQLRLGWWARIQAPPPEPVHSTVHSSLARHSQRLPAWPTSASGQAPRASQASSRARPRTQAGKSKPKPPFFSSSSCSA